MLLSKGSVKLRSLGASPFVLTLLAGLTAAATSGCFFVDDGDDGDHSHWDDDDYDHVGDDDTPPPVDTIEQVAIQPDRVLEAVPGEGVGIFVEYGSGGKWHVWTTCDTFTSKSVCSFSIFASTRDSTTLFSYASDRTEGFDTVTDLGDGTVELIVDTDSDVDGLWLETTAGAPLTLEVYLDGQSAEPFVYWVSNDVIHPGAPDNPIQMVPTLP